MKRKRISVAVGVVLALAIIAGIAIPLASAANVSVTFLNPLGKLEPLKNQPLAERLADLEGKEIALAYYAKDQNPHAVRAIGEMLEEEFGISAKLYDIGSSVGAKPQDWYDDMAKSDAVVLGVADCTLSSWWAAYHAKMIEARGTPVAVLTHSAFEKALDAGAMDNGFTGVRRAILDPGFYSAGYVMMSASSNTDYLRDTAFTATTDTVPVSVYDQVKAALTSPLTDEEKNPPEITLRMLTGWEGKDYDPSAETFTVTSTSEAKAAVEFNDLAMELGFGDGLPLIVPRQELVDKMLEATVRDRGEMIGRIMPRGGDITVEKVAVNAVMAGARPEYFPVILAAMEAYAGCWEDGDLLYHSLTSSDNYTMMVIVSGPIVPELGISGQWGYLGSGNEANNGIGRAIRLCIRNIGQNRTHVTDGTARSGRQNDHALTVFGEEPKLLPEGWEGHNQMLGFDRDQNTVTLHGYSSQTMYAAMGGVNSAFNPQNILRNIRNENSSSIGVATIPRNVADLSRSQNGIENKQMLLDYLLDAGNGNQKLYSRYLLWPVIVGDPDSARLYKDTNGIYGTKGFRSALIGGAVLTETARDAVAPGTPQNFAVTRSGDSAELTWEAPVSSGGGTVTGYQVTCTGGAAGGAFNPEGETPVINVTIPTPAAAAGSKIPAEAVPFTDSGRETAPAWVDVPSGQMSYTFSGLDPDGEYTFAVRAISDIRNAVRVIGEGTSQKKNTYDLDYGISGRGAWALEN